MLIFINIDRCEQSNWVEPPTSMMHNLLVNDILIFICHPQRLSKLVCGIECNGRYSKLLVLGEHGVRE